MDSITQIVLGAAVGEVVMGKKAGNRAMLWGAIAGTIPDLDVLANFVADDLTALAFHRGISHSIFFAVTAPVLFAFLTEKFYKSGLYQQKLYKYFAVFASLLFVGVILLGINYIPYSTSGNLNFYLAGGSIFGLLGLLYLFYSNYLSKRLQEVNLSFKNWYWLFFWCIFTHPLLDCCTTYGTQLFQPFSNYRVALNNISVADPLYTVPFAICLLIARYLTRGSKLRYWVNMTGLIISSIYMVWTVSNKFKVNKVFEKSLANHEYQYSRYTTSPTIFNNVLWTGTAEGDSVYYQGFYSILDKQDEILKFNVIPKNHHLVADRMDTRPMKVLPWFSKDYYTIKEGIGDTLQYYDLRFGTAKVEPDGGDGDFIFGFKLYDENGVFVAEEEEPPRGGEDGNIGKVLAELWERMKGV